MVSWGNSSRLGNPVIRQPANGDVPLGLAAARIADAWLRAPPRSASGPRAVPST